MMKWKTKEWYPTKWIVVYWLSSDLCGLSLQFNKYQLDLQLGWFGFTVNKSFKRK